MITNVLSQMTDDVKVAAYRQQVFADIIRLPELRKTMTELFDKAREANKAVDITDEP